MPKATKKAKPSFLTAFENSSAPVEAGSSRKRRGNTSPEVAVKAVPWKPWPYQTRSAQFLVDRAAAGLFLDPGLGKTSSTLAALVKLKEKGLFRHALILAPLRVARNVWPAEVKKWKEFSHLRVVVLHGPKKDELLKEEADICDDAHRLPAAAIGEFPWLPENTSGSGPRGNGLPWASISVASLPKRRHA